MNNARIIVSVRSVRRICVIRRWIKRGPSLIVLQVDVRRMRFVRYFEFGSVQKSSDAQLCVVYASSMCDYARDTR